MYNIRHLFDIGYQGLSDLVPAVRQAFNADPTDDRLNEVYGKSPRASVIGISILAIAAGELIGRYAANLPFTEFIHWPAVVVGLVFALLLRRYLFYDGSAREGVHESDFPWLAASLVAPLGLLIIESFMSQILAPRADPGDAQQIFIGKVALFITHELGVAAAMTIAVAALCFSRDWLHALFDLAVRLLVFRVMVFVTTLVMLEIGIVGPIVGAVLRGIFGFRLPEWLPDLADQLSYAGVMIVIYLAVIGATWTVCRQSFDELLHTGHVDILKTIEELADDPKRRQKKRVKQEKKESRRSQKAARRNK